MDFNALFKLLGINQQQPQQQPARRYAEDDAIVETPQGRMPLSSVERGGQWRNVVGPTQYAGAPQVFKARPQPDLTPRYPRPQIQRFEDGSMRWGDQGFPSYDSIEDFMPRRGSY